MKRKLTQSSTLVGKLVCNPSSNRFVVKVIIFLSVYCVSMQVHTRARVLVFQFQVFFFFFGKSCSLIFIKRKSERIKNWMVIDIIALHCGRRPCCIDSFLFRPFFVVVVVGVFFIWAHCHHLICT